MGTCRSAKESVTQRKKNRQRGISGVFSNLTPDFYPNLPPPSSSFFSSSDKRQPLFKPLPYLQDILDVPGDLDSRFIIITADLSSPGSRYNRCTPCPVPSLFETSTTLQTTILSVIYMVNPGLSSVSLAENPRTSAPTPFDSYFPPPLAPTDHQLPGEAKEPTAATATPADRPKKRKGRPSDRIQECIVVDVGSSNTKQTTQQPSKKRRGRLPKTAVQNDQARVIRAGGPLVSFGSGATPGHWNWTKGHTYKPPKEISRTAITGKLPAKYISDSPGGGPLSCICNSEPCCCAYIVVDTVVSDNYWVKFQTAKGSRDDLKDDFTIGDMNSVHVKYVFFPFRSLAWAFYIRIPTCSSFDLANS